MFIWQLKLSKSTIGEHVHPMALSFFFLPPSLILLTCGSVSGSQAPGLGGAGMSRGSPSSLASSPSSIRGWWPLRMHQSHTRASQCSACGEGHAGLACSQRRARRPTQWRSASVPTCSVFLCTDSTSGGQGSAMGSTTDEPVVEPTELQQQLHWAYKAYMLSANTSKHAAYPHS